MKRLARPWLWLWPLTAFLACLNPQPDDTPLAAERAPGVDDQPAGAAVGGPPESPVFNLDDDATSVPEPQVPANSSPDPGQAADAGVPPAPDGGLPPDAASALD